MTSCKIKVESNLSKKEANKKVDKLENKVDDLKAKLRSKMGDKLEAELDTLKKYFAKNPDIDPIMKKKIMDQYYDHFKKFAHDDMRAEVVKTKAINQQMRIIQDANLPTPGKKIKFLINQTNRLMISKERLYHGMVITGLKELGLEGFAKDEANFGVIRRELIQLRESGGKPGITGSFEAQEVAKVYRKFMNAVHNDVTSAGAPLGFVDGYIPRKWLPEKFIGVSESDFINKFLPALDVDKLPRSWSEKELVAYLKDFKNKIELKDDSIFNPYMESLPKSTLDRMIVSRGIPLKPEYEANLIEEFADTDLFRTMFTYGTSMAKRSALLDGFGPSTQQGFKDFAQLLMEQATDKQKALTDIKKAEAGFNYFINPYQWGTGESALAKGFDLFRSGASASILKVMSAVKATIMDGASSAGYNHAVHGENIFKGIASYYANFFQAATLNVTDKKKLAEALGLMHRISLTENQERLGMSGKVQGGIGKVINMLHSSTLMPMQQTFSQQAIRLASSNTLVSWMDTGFKNLDPIVKATLDRYGIGESDFQILQNHRTKLGMTEVINETSLFNGGKDAALVWNKVTKLLNKSEASIGIPGPIENAVWKSNNPDTIPGQLWRTIGMFKTFPMALMNNMGEIKDFNPTAKAEMVNGFNRFKGNYGNVAQAMAGMMGAAYAGIVLNEYLMNDRTPPKMDMDLLARVAAESGAIGLYADVLTFDISNRYGIMKSGFSLLGPGVSTATDGLMAIYGLGQGAFNEEKEADATELLKFIAKRKPGNLPFLKPILDQAFWEALDPEYAMRRAESEMKTMEERGQQPAGLR